MALEFRVPDALGGERIDRVISTLADLSRAEAAGVVANGNVALNGRPVTVRSHRVRAGDVLSLPDPPAKHDGVVPDPAVPFTTVFADRAVIVVDKPAGLVVHPGAGNSSGTLVHGLVARYPDVASAGAPDRPGIVHRLDKDTSGLLVVARTAAAYDELVRQIKARQVARRYDALVWGHLRSERGVIDAPIGRSARAPTRMAVSRAGRAARTRYEVRHAYRDPVAVSLLRCELETGRTHQIRVHLAAIGHPVVGDKPYQGDRTSLPVPRFFLHAASLGFTHPVTGEWMEFESPLPPDLAGVLARLGA